MAEDPAEQNSSSWFRVPVTESANITMERSSEPQSIHPEDRLLRADGLGGEAMAKALIDGIRKMAKEYENEEKHLQGIFDQMPFTEDDPSEEGKKMLGALVDHAEAVGVDKVYSKSAFLKHWELLLKESEQSMKLASLARERDLPQKKNRRLQQETSMLERELAIAKEECMQWQTQKDLQKLELCKMKDKLEVYKREIAENESALTQKGVDPNFGHQQVYAAFDELSILKGDAVLLKSKLKKFQYLPPDMIEARRRVAQMKQELRLMQDPYTKVLKEISDDMETFKSFN